MASIKRQLAAGYSNFKDLSELDIIYPTQPLHNCTNLCAREDEKRDERVL